MFNFTTNNPAIDRENKSLYKASEILESMGNSPDLTAEDFYEQIMTMDVPAEEVQAVTLAAIAIETMMVYDQQSSESLLESESTPTVH